MASIFLHRHPIGQIPQPHERVDYAFVLILQIAAGRYSQTFRAGHKALKGLKGIVRFVDKVRPLNLPVGRIVLIIIQLNLIAVLQDAANLDAGQIEDLAADLGCIAVSRLRLEEQQIFRLAGQRDDGTIRVDGAAFDIDDLGRAAQVRWNLHRGQFLALLGEHLDPGIEGLVVKRIVGDFLDVEVNRGRAGSLGIAGHLQLFRRGLLKLRAQKSWSDQEKKQEKSGNIRSNSHGLPWLVDNV